MSDAHKLWTCPKCQRQWEYSQPLIVQGCRGAQTPIHECGPGFIACRLKPASKDAKTF